VNKGENSDLSNNSHKFVLITVADGIKRVIESMNKRIDSFVYYSSGSLKREKDGHPLTSRGGQEKIYKTLDAGNHRHTSHSISGGDLYSTLVS